MNKFLNFFKSYRYLQKQNEFLHGEIASLNSQLKSNYSRKKNKKNENKIKIFCIGCLKTGTTSMESFLSENGFEIGDQGTAEKLILNWAKRDWKELIEYCKTADAFQDVPFSFPFTYVILDHAFPNSKFILTERENEEVWYSSYIRFTKKIIKDRFALKDDKLLLPKTIKAYDYRYKGYLFDVQKYGFNVDENNIYSPKIYKKVYNEHNSAVKNYFKFSPNKLLSVKLNNKDAKKIICEFLDVKYDNKPFPHLNKSN